MKKLLVLILLFSAATALIAGNYNDSFNTYLDNGEYEAADSVLQLWQDEAKDDPELYPARFNLLLNKARFSFIVVDDDTHPEEAIALILADSLGNKAGSIHTVNTWNDSLVNEALNIITQGIAAHPDRLDFRFGKASAAGYVKNMDIVTTTCIDAIDRSLVNHNQWLWTNDEQLDSVKGHDILFEGLYDFIRMVDEADQTDQKLLDYIITTFPNYTIGLNYKGMIETGVGNYEEAKKYFTRALEIDPTDQLIECNLGMVNIKQGNFAEAAKIYRHIVENPDADPEWKEEAQFYLSQLEQILKDQAADSE